MDIWNKLIDDGDRLYDRCQYENAKGKYIRAVERSRFLYFNWSEKEAVINSIVKSHDRLLECLLANYQYEFAGNVILQSHRIVDNILSTIDDQTTLYNYVESVSKRLKGRIFELLSLYPEIIICDDCYSDIFGYPQQYKQTKFYTIN